jgi:hypothetical protein
MIMEGRFIFSKAPVGRCFAVFSASEENRSLIEDEV